MSRHFRYYDKSWEDEILECPFCHWKGKFHQGAARSQHDADEDAVLFDESLKHE